MPPHEVQREFGPGEKRAAPAKSAPSIEIVSDCCGSTLTRPWRPKRGSPDILRGGRAASGATHIDRSPFYYIDYTLAQVCALQFWTRSEKDFDEALTSYVALCKRGGEAPFQQLTKGAGLHSPFEAGALDEVVERASATLEI